MNNGARTILLSVGVIVRILEARRKRRLLSGRPGTSIANPLDQSWNHHGEFGGKRFDCGGVEPLVEIFERELDNGLCLVEIALAFRFPFRF